MVSSSALINSFNRFLSLTEILKKILIPALSLWETEFLMFGRIILFLSYLLEDFKTLFQSAEFTIQWALIQFI